jgi:uncharacterized membrane protein
MTILVLGLILWTVAHVFKRAAPGMRGALAEAAGAGPTRGVMALLIGLGVLLMIIGYRRSAFVPVYDPPAWGIHVNNLAMLFAVGLMGAGQSKGRVRSWLRHPMLTGVIVWALAHLLVNGDEASLILFGWLGAWAVVSILLINAREPVWVRPAPGPGSGDIRLVGIAVVIYAVIAAVHAWLGYWPFPR